MTEEGRRSMSQALRTGEWSVEMRDFIKAGNPPSRVSPGDSEAGRAPQAAAPVPLEPTQREPVIERPRSQAKESGSLNSREAPGPERLVSMTVRVPCEIPRKLLRISADRKLQRLKPGTQQEIVADALSQWFKKNDN